MEIVKVCVRAPEPGVGVLGTRLHPPIIPSSYMDVQLLMEPCKWVQLLVSGCSCNHFVSGANYSVSEIIIPQYNPGCFPALSSFGMCTT